MKKKYLESLQINTSNGYCKSITITWIFNQRNLFNNSSLFLLYLNVHKKTGIPMFF